LAEKTELLLVFASETEAAAFKKKLNRKGISLSERDKFAYEKFNAEIFISGIGIPATMYSLTKKIVSKHYDLVINAGICGSFNDDFSLGDCVSIVLDEFADIGITHNDTTFQTLFEENLIKPNAKPFNNGKLYNPLKFFVDTELPKVTAITINNVSGYGEQIEFRRKKFNPDVESMEGAAVAYICKSENIKFLQIRAISNMVEERNKENWDIPLATENLADELFSVLDKISGLN
jgi:futalosine hydrolase